MPAPATCSETTLKQLVVDDPGAVGVLLGLTTSSNSVSDGANGTGGFVRITEYV